MNQVTSGELTLDIPSGPEAHKDPQQPCCISMLPAGLLRFSLLTCLLLVRSVHLPVGGQVCQAALEEDSLSWDCGYFERVAQK